MDIDPRQPMSELLLNATLKVIIDGQAYLYAHTLQVDAEILGQSVNDEQLEVWQDEWKKETRDLIQAQFEIKEEGNSL